MIISGKLFPRMGLPLRNVTSAFQLYSFINPEAFVSSASLSSRSFSVTRYPSLQRTCLQRDRIYSNNKPSRVFSISAGGDSLTGTEKKRISWVFEVYTNAKASSVAPESLGHKILLKAPLDLGMPDEKIEKIVSMEADALICNSELEGSHALPNAAHIKNFVVLSAEEGIISIESGQRVKNFLDKFPQGKKDHYTAYDFTRSVRDLKPGEGVGYFGGWHSLTDETGHALIYFFKKREDGLYDIYLYNTGGGIKRHDSILVTDGTRRKQLYCPYIKFQGVEPERLGITQKTECSNFFERLFRLKDSSYGSSEISRQLYEDRDYFGAFHDRLTKNDESAPYIEVQRAGTCAFSVILAAIRLQFTSEEEYQRFSLSLQIRDLLTLSEKTEMATALPSRRLLLQNQGQRLLRLLEKQSLLISKKEEEKVEAVLSCILEKIPPVIGSTPVIADEIHLVEDRVKKYRFDLTDVRSRLMPRTRGDETRISSTIMFEDMTVSEKAKDEEEFLDPKGGERFRIFDGKISEVLFEARWYQYNPFFKQKPSQFMPSFLITDHECFNSGEDFVLLNKESRKIAFSITGNGVITDLSNQKHVAWLCEDVRIEGLDLFQPFDKRLHEMGQDGIKKIRFPGIVMDGGKELSLIGSGDGCFVLENDPNFVLIKPISGLFFGLKSVLCFQNRNTQEIRIFVVCEEFFIKSLGPVQAVFRQEARGAIHIDNEKLIKARKLDRPYGKQKSIAEYSYVKGALLPKDSKAKIFLSYIALFQKEELESSVLLLGLKEKKLTKEEERVLYWISRALWNSNGAPAAAAVSLRAAILLCSQGEDTDLIERTQEKSKFLIWSYRDLYNNIPVDLRLTSKEIEQSNALFSEQIVQKSPKRIMERIPSTFVNKQIFPKGFPSSTTANDTLQFIRNYTKLYQASSLKERMFILAESETRGYPDCLKAVLFLAGRFDGPLPPPPEKTHTLQKIDRVNLIDDNLSVNDFMEFIKGLLPASEQEEIERWMSQFLYSPYDQPVYSIPPQIGIENEDDPLPRGQPLRSLEEVLEEVQTAEPSSLPLAPIEIPSLDLESSFIRPYFTKMEVLTEEGASRRETSFMVKKGVSEETVRGELTLEIIRRQEILKTVKKELLSLASVAPRDPVQAQKVNRLRKAKVLSQVNFQRLETCYQQNDYRELNPYLRKDQQEKLQEGMEKFLAASSEVLQMEKALQSKSINETGRLIQEALLHKSILKYSHPKKS